MSMKKVLKISRGGKNQTPQDVRHHRPEESFEKEKLFNSGDLNTGLVWYSNGQKLSNCQMVRYTNAN